VLEKISERVVVFTLFLNGAGGPGTHTFTGGEFVLHPWADRRLVLPCAPGILVAFRADLVHSVRAVTAGTRHAVTGWFRDPVGRLAPHPGSGSPRGRDPRADD
jgi:predicted 2-oxoglutarate/Fe(II)-dependent dioxygenase YbiX